MNKILLLMAFLIFSMGAAAQQSGSIKGKVLTSDGSPAEYISIVVTGTNLGAVTNAKGDYKINGIKPGTYTLKASAVGAIAQEQQVTIIAKETSTADFTISYSSAQLKQVNINSEKINRLAIKKSETVARLPLTSLENPQSYVSIGQTLMKDQAIVNISDALKNSSGLDKIWTSTGRGGDGATYYTLRGFSTQIALVNGIPGMTNGDIDPAGIENIEVIKGPSGTLFGGAVVNFGGLINLNTKRATIDTIGGEVTYNVGSYGLNRITTDFYAPINQSKTALFRLNAAYHDQNSFQDAGFRKSIYVAPAFRLLLNERATLDLGAEFSSAQGTNPLMVFLNRSRQLIARTPAELNFDWGRSYTNNDLVVKTPSTNIHGQLNYKISDNWTSQTNVGQSYRKSDGYYQYVMYLGADDQNINRLAAYSNSYSTTFNFQQNFIGDFSLLGLRNRLVAGLDFLNQYTNNNTSPYVQFDVVNTLANQIPATYGTLSRITLDPRIAAAGAAGASKGDTENNVYSAYASNVLNVTDNLLAMVSLRVDRFASKGSFNNLTNVTTGGYLQTSWSPKFGLVYQPLKDKISIFGNYQNGFRNVAPGNQLINGVLAIAPYKPQHANQLEAGVKLDIFQNKLALTASYYDIKVTNIFFGTTGVVNGTTVTYNVQDGTQRSKGYELDLIANPIPGLNLIFGYSHNDSEITNAGPQTNGRRPVGAGPENLINFWGSYSILNGKAKGLGIGVGGNYAGENIITNTLATGMFILPAYTVVNGTLFYDINKFRVGAKVDNIANKQYFKGWTTVEVQQPRTYQATFTMRF